MYYFSQWDLMLGTADDCGLVSVDQAGRGRGSNSIHLPNLVLFPSLVRF